MEQNQKITDVETVKKYVNPVAFNSLGLRPTKAEYTLLTSQLEKEIIKRVKKWISEIEYVSFHPNNKGEVTTVVWLSGNSRHFKDTSTENTVIGKPIKRYSEDLKDFAAKFGAKGNQKKANINQAIVYPDRQDSRNLVGIKIDLAKFIRMLFDIDNIEYNKAMGTSIKSNCTFKYRWHFKSYKDNPFDTPEFIEITKMEKNMVRDKAPKAIRSGKF